MTTTMRAVTQEAFGGPEVLHVAERPIPEPNLTEVLVRVHAAGINPVDVGTRRGGGVSDVVGEPPFVLGWDVSGVVEFVAPGVTRFALGDEVYGMPRFPHQAGTHAEYVVGPARHFARKPETLSHDEAGALALAGLTAWQALVDTAAVQPGQRVLVHGAGGGVGHLAVQIARARGAEVVATARPVKHAVLTELGASEVIDYTTTPFEEAVGQVDLVLDLVWEPEDAFRALGVLPAGGRLIYVPSDLLPDGLAFAAAGRGVRATTILVEPDHQGLGELAALADAGQLRVLVDRRFPLEEAGAAHEHLLDNHPLGKVVLVP